MPNLIGAPAGGSGLWLRPNRNNLLGGLPAFPFFRPNSLGWSQPSNNLFQNFPLNTGQSLFSTWPSLLTTNNESSSSNLESGHQESNGNSSSDETAVENALPFAHLTYKNTSQSTNTNDTVPLKQIKDSSLLAASQNISNTLINGEPSLTSLTPIAANSNLHDNISASNTDRQGFRISPFTGSSSEKMTAKRFPYSVNTISGSEANVSDAFKIAFESLPNSKRGNNNEIRAFGQSDTKRMTNNTPVGLFQTMFAQLLSPSSVPKSSEHFVNIPDSIRERIKAMNRELSINPSNLPQTFLRNPSAERLIQTTEESSLNVTDPVKEVEHIFKRLELPSFKRKHIKLPSLEIQDRLKGLVIRWMENEIATKENESTPTSIISRESTKTRNIENGAKIPKQALSKDNTSQDATFDTGWPPNESTPTSIISRESTKTRNIENGAKIPKQALSKDNTSQNATFDIRLPPEENTPVTAIPKMSTKNINDGNGVKRTQAPSMNNVSQDTQSDFDFQLKNKNRKMKDRLERKEYPTKETKQKLTKGREKVKIKRKDTFEKGAKNRSGYIEAHLNMSHSTPNNTISTETTESKSKQVSESEGFISVNNRNNTDLGIEISRNTVELKSKQTDFTENKNISLVHSFVEQRKRKQQNNKRKSLKSKERQFVDNNNPPTQTNGHLIDADDFIKDLNSSLTSFTSHPIENLVTVTKSNQTFLEGPSVHREIKLQPYTHDLVHTVESQNNTAEKSQNNRIETINVETNLEVMSLLDPTSAQMVVEHAVNKNTEITNLIPEAKTINEERMDKLPSYTIKSDIVLPPIIIKNFESDQSAKTRLLSKLVSNNEKVTPTESRRQPTQSESNKKKFTPKENKQTPSQSVSNKTIFTPKENRRLPIQSVSNKKKFTPKENERPSSQSVTNKTIFTPIENRRLQIQSVSNKKKFTPNENERPSSQSVTNKTIFTPIENRRLPIQSVSNKKKFTPKENKQTPSQTVSNKTIFTPIENSRLPIQSVSNKKKFTPKENERPSSKSVSNKSKFTLKENRRPSLQSVKLKTKVKEDAAMNESTNFHPFGLFDIMNNPTEMHGEIQRKGNKNKRKQSNIEQRHESLRIYEKHGGPTQTNISKRNNRVGEASGSLKTGPQKRPSKVSSGDLLEKLLAENSGNTFQLFNTAPSHKKRAKVDNGLSRLQLTNTDRSAKRKATKVGHPKHNIFSNKSESQLLPISILELFYNRQSVNKKKIEKQLRPELPMIRDGRLHKEVIVSYQPYTESNSVLRNEHISDTESTGRKSETQTNIFQTFKYRNIKPRDNTPKSQTNISMSKFKTPPPSYIYTPKSLRGNTSRRSKDISKRNHPLKNATRLGINILNYFLAK